MVSVITDEENPVLADYRACTPLLPRIGEAEDVAQLARFLIGPESSWITGQVITVDGGHSLRRGPDFTPWLEPAYGAEGLRVGWSRTSDAGPRPQPKRVFLTNSQMTSLALMS